MTEGNLGTENKKERILYSSVGEAEAVRGNWDQTLWGITGHIRDFGV